MVVSKIQKCGTSLPTNYLRPITTKNDFAQILSPNPDDAGVWIHQDAWFYLSDFNADFQKNFLKKGNGFTS